MQPLGRVDSTVDSPAALEYDPRGLGHAPRLMQYEVSGKKMARERTPTHGVRGWELTEYLILVALIAIAAIGVVSLFGDQIEELFSEKPPAAAAPAPKSAK
jgi:Flp pilus assembly pilin Flp